MSGKARKPRAKNFAPYQRYLENRDLLTKHLNATEIAYALTVCVLSDSRVKAASQKRVDAILTKADSFTKADFSVEKVETCLRLGEF